VKDDKEQSGSALVPFVNRGLTRNSTGPVRRGLDDLLKGQSRINSSDNSSSVASRDRGVEGLTGLNKPKEEDPFATLNRIGREMMRGDVTNSLGMHLVRIPEGKFMMGSDAEDDEKPIHEVTISRPFYMGIHPATQSEWQEIMGNNPSEFIGADYPVHGVSWNDAQEFIRKLNILDVWFEYRLPSEAEWEHACRAGTTGDFAGPLDSMAWYGNNSGQHYLEAAQIWQTGADTYGKRLNDNGNQMHPVGTKEANTFGLYDMHGNVWEWCEDWYHETYYGAPTDSSAWLTGGEMKYRVLRGGSWSYEATDLRSAVRIYDAPDDRSSDFGFRLVAVVRA
jgi:formylglycine-generating enzyme required for sulfatase activity